MQTTALQLSIIISVGSVNIIPSVKTSARSAGAPVSSKEIGFPVTGTGVVGNVSNNLPPASSAHPMRHWARHCAEPGSGRWPAPRVQSTIGRRG